MGLRRRSVTRDVDVVSTSVSTCRVHNSVMDTTERSGQELIPANLDEPLVLSVTNAARLLGISRALAYELAARGEIPVLRLGRRIVVPKSALLELVQAVKHHNVGA